MKRCIVSVLEGGGLIWGMGTLYIVGGAVGSDWAEVEDALSFWIVESNMFQASHP